MAREPGGGQGAQGARRGLRAWAERHALACFFGLTYAISWAIWLAEPLVAGYDPISSTWLGMLAPFGPALAAVALAALTGRGRAAPRGLAARLGPTALVLGAAMWASWGRLEDVRASAHPAFAAACWLTLTLLPAWLVFLAGAGARGVRDLLGSLVRWRQPLNSYLLALLLMPVAGLAGIVLLRALGGPWPAFPQSGPPLEVARNLATVFVATVLYGGGLGEEPGWRGFALPRLQHRFDPLTASAILSIAWSLWFVPLLLLGAQHSALPLGQALVLGIALRLFSILPVAIAYTWLANRTGGSLLLLALMHASVNNTAGWWLPVTAGLTLGTVALAPVLVLLDRMWRRR